jgi:cytoskeleton protein RodZ
MSKFGERLRKTRESLGLSLSQVATETRILQQWIVALEEGALDRLPNDVATRGFIRNYCQFLDLPSNEILDQYRRERGLGNPIQIVPTSSMVAKQSFVLPSFFGVFFVTMALIGITYAIFSIVGRIGTSQIAQRPEITVIDLTTPVPANLTEAFPNGKQEATEKLEEGTDLATTLTDGMPTPITIMPTPTLRPIAGMVGSTQSPRTATADSLLVEVSIEPGASGSWIRIQTDDEIAYEQIMRSGERRVFEAKQRIQIRAGNQSVVNVSVNGMPAKKLGTVPGQPVNWTWPPR